MSRYAVHYCGGGRILATNNRAAAIIRALTEHHPCEVVRTRTGESLDLSGCEIEYDDDGRPYLVEVAS